jgi:phosphatidylserine/phosphatidylglycerophosphate/cardiolipin synthase-like enzyme
MHNKFCVADGQVLVNGSYNWTKGARFENRENIVITNHPELVQQFTIEFNRLWQEFQGNSTLQSGCGGDNGKTRGMGGED